MPRFLLLAFFSLPVFSVKVSLEECRQCCTEYINQIEAGSSAIQIAQDVERCQLGCTQNFEEDFACTGSNNLQKCQIGDDFRVQGFTVESSSNIVFCAGGNIDVSFAPTKSPTPPTLAPTIFPTKFPISLGSGSTSFDKTPIFIGIGGGCILLIIIVAYILTPGRKKKKLESEKKAEERLSSRYKSKLPEISVESVENFGEFEVRFTFIAEHDDEITANSGEVLQGVSKINDDWFLMKRPSTGQIGMIPISFLQKKQIKQKKSKIRDDEELF